MIYKSTIDWLKAMKSHKCENKDLIPADDPSSDIYTAIIEKREPEIFPKRGYSCMGCESAFYIELRNAIKK